MIALYIIGDAGRLDASPMYHIIIDVAEHSTYFSDNAGDQWFFELRLQLNGISEMHIFFGKKDTSK